MSSREGSLSHRILRGWKREVSILRFTRHVRNRMRLYRLTDAEVTEALHQPDHVTPSSHGEKHAWKQIPRGWLRVTYTQEGSGTVLITVTIRRRGPEEA